MDKVISVSDNSPAREAFSDRFESFCRDLQRFISKLETLNGATEPSGPGKPDRLSCPSAPPKTTSGPVPDFPETAAGEWLQKTIDQDLPTFKNIMEKFQSYVRQYEEELQTTRIMLDKSENLARVGLHMGGVLHELNNLVGSMMGHAELAKLTGEEEDITKCVDTALEATKRARTLLRQIRGISRLKNTLDVMNLTETIESVVHLLEPVVQGKGIHLEWEIQPVPWIIGSAKAIRQAILILSSTLLDSIPEGGTLCLTCSQVGNEIRVGIAEDRNRDLEKVQLPLTSLLNEFHETYMAEPPMDQSRRSVLDNMIAETKGRLECACRIGKGYAYQIALPVNF